MYPFVLHQYFVVFRIKYFAQWIVYYWRASGAGEFRLFIIFVDLNTSTFWLAERSVSRTLFVWIIKYINDFDLFAQFYLYIYFGEIDFCWELIIIYNNFLFLELIWFFFVASNVPLKWKLLTFCSLGWGGARDIFYSFHRILCFCSLNVKNKTNGPWKQHRLFLIMIKKYYCAP